MVPDPLSLNPVKESARLELGRWNGFDPKNPYVPTALQNSMAADEKRSRMELLENVIEWPYSAGADSRKKYIEFRLDDSALREKALQHIITNLSFSWNDNQQRLIALQQELYMSRKETAHLKTLVAKLAKEPGATGSQTPTSKTENIPSVSRSHIICIISAGLVNCADERALVRYFSSGYWKNGIWNIGAFNEARVRDALRQLEGLADRFNLDPSKDAYVGCSLGWYSTNAPKTLATVKAGNISPSQFPKQLSADELAGMLEGCDVVNSAMLANMPNLSGGKSAASKDAIQQAEDSIAEKCLIRSHEGVMSNETPLAPPKGYKGLGKEVLTGLLDKAVVIINLFNRECDAELCASDYKAINDAADAAHQAKAAENRTNEALEDHLEAVGDLDDAQKAFDQALRDVNDNPSPENLQKLNEATEKLRQAQAKEQEAKMKAEKAAEEEAAAKKKAADAAEAVKKKTGKTVSVSARRDSQNPAMSECEKMKARWAWFKKICDSRDGWDRPGDICNDFVRRALHCVNPDLVNPGPDGKSDCKKRNLSDEETHKLACENRQTLYMTHENSAKECTQFFQRPTYVDRDICIDPRAMCSPDDQKALRLVDPQSIIRISDRVENPFWLPTERLLVFDALEALLSGDADRLR